MSGRRLMFNVNRIQIQHRQRKGAIAPLSALFLVVLMAMVAFAVDMGLVMVAQADLQRAADAAAHAAVLEYRSDSSPWIVLPRVRRTARQYVADNEILNSAATVNLNWFNADPDGDVVVGKIDFENPRRPMTFGDRDEYNAVCVKVRRASNRNGELPLFFARVLGYESIALEAKCTAAIIQNVSGFKIPGSGENVPFLPITIHEDFWEQGLAANNDDWSYNSLNQSIRGGADDVPEVVLYPNDTGSSGNFGTLNVGISANSTSHLARQIREGLNESDLAYHGGELALNNQGELRLSGDPGLSASIKDDLDAIAGKPVMIPIYRQVAGNGNNAEFTIVKFVGVRIMAVSLTGGEKFVAVQPANVRYKGVVQSPGNLQGTSNKIYSPPVVVQ